MRSWLDALDTGNDQGEYYLTDIVAMAHAAEVRIRATLVDETEVIGVNNKSQLAFLERYYQMGKANTLLEQGVTLLDPARLDVRGDVDCGRDVQIDVNVVLEGQVRLGDGVSVGANCVIKDSSIGAGTKILAGTHIEGAEIGKETTIGPVARLRPGTVLGDGCKMGISSRRKTQSSARGQKRTTSLTSATRSLAMTATSGPAQSSVTTTVQTSIRPRWGITFLSGQTASLLRL